MQESRAVIQHAINELVDIYGRLNDIENNNVYRQYERIREVIGVLVESLNRFHDQTPPVAPPVQEV